MDVLELHYIYTYSAVTESFGPSVENILINGVKIFHCWHTKRRKNSLMALCWCQWYLCRGYDNLFVNWVNLYDKHSYFSTINSFPIIKNLWAMFFIPTGTKNSRNTAPSTGCRDIACEVLDKSRCSTSQRREIVGNKGHCVQIENTKAYIYIYIYALVFSIFIIYIIYIDICTCISAYISICLLTHVTDKLKSAHTSGWY